MKGMMKAINRTPHMLTSKIGMANKSSDPEFDELNRRFGSMETYADKLNKDAICFRDSINTMINSSSAFAEAFLAIFTPGGTEYDLESRYPGAAETIQQIGSYQTDMADLRESLAPEVELIETRIIAPSKEFVETLKKIRKTITKRDHKLVDYDRHNNTYTKLRDKQNKSLSDEKNMFKVEQDFEIASQEYEFHNNALKNELPRFFELATAFITPLFQSFYYMQLQCIYVMVEKMQAYTGGKFDLSVDVEQAFQAKVGDAPEQVENLTITKRIVSTSHMMKQYGGPQRAASGSASLSSRPSISSKPSLSRTSSTSTTQTGAGAGVGPSATAAAAPPPYSPSNSTSPPPAGGSMSKRAPPPPPPAARPKPATPPTLWAVALYDFGGQAEGDLHFEAGSRIEIVQKTDSTEDWWTGRLDGQTGQLPANYVQLEGQ